jgi:hypothetical protein
MPEDAASDLAAELDQNTQDAPEASESPEQETPAAEPQEGSSAEVDWQERYANLQPEYTRTTQELAQYRQLIDAARAGDPEALEFLGYAAEDDEEEDDDYTDPDERYEQRFAELETRIQEKEAAEQEAELHMLEAAYVEQELEAIEDQEGNLSDEEKGAIVALANQIRDDDGDPDVSTAYELLTNASKAAQQRYIKSKRAEKVEIGTAGSEKVKLDTEEDRANALATLIEAGEQD